MKYKTKVNKVLFQLIKYTKKFLKININMRKRILIDRTLKNYFIMRVILLKKLIKNKRINQKIRINQNGQAMYMT